MRTSHYALLVLFLAVFRLLAVPDAGAMQVVELTQTENHHVAELNSNQPYVAGYHVDTVDLYTRECAQATAVTVSFPSTDSSYFSQGSWLGAGMFVQDQDSKIINVDYGFYTMLVLDASGDLFLDVGLHQTRESSLPIQMPTEDLIYAYTWHVSGIDPATPVTLLARWDSLGFVHYSLSTSETSIDVSSVNVAARTKCESIIRLFYAGDATNGNAFPLGHYVYYFQFGVISSESIANDHWSADVKDPRLLRTTGWDPVDIAWSTQGDLSYLDSDWMWGGAPYTGVSAQYYQNQLQNPYELIFNYSGRTLTPGTILWQVGDLELNNPLFPFNQLGQAIVLLVVACGVVICIGLFRPKKRVLRS